jgi:hypothetical protein
MIKSIKLRFDKWKHSTERAHLLVYHGKEVWLAKKLCWDFQIAGNDLHAWATVPAWLFKEITGADIDEIYVEDGISGLREHYDAMVQTIVEEHVPESISPVENNIIPELKK